MPAIRLVRRRAVRSSGLAAWAGLVLLVALASLLVASRLRVPPPVHTIAVGRAPMAVAVDARTRRVLVANFGSSTVSVLDADSGAVLATVPVVPHPSTLAVARNAGRVFAVSDHVTPDGAGRVSVLDAASGRLLRTVAVGQGEHALVVHEGTGRVFVTNAGDASLSVLDARSGHVLRTISVGQPPLAVAAVASLHHVFVARGDLWYGALRATPGTVSMLDGHTGAVVRTVPVGGSPSPLAVDEGTGYVFVANHDDISVSLVDAGAGRIVRTVLLGLPPRALAVDPRRGRVVVLTSEEFVPAAPAGRVQVLEGRTGWLLHTVAVGADASALAVDERTGKVFATAMNAYGMPGDSDSTRLLRAWLRRWLPWSWVLRLLPPARIATTGTVTMLDLSRMSA